jgi:hypothetical protein
MTKVTLDLPKGELVRIFSQLSMEEREEILKKIGKECGVVKPKLVLLEEVLKLTGITSAGGDALVDTERMYDE